MCFLSILAEDPLDEVHNKAGISRTAQSKNPRWRRTPGTWRSDLQVRYSVITPSKYCYLFSRRTLDALEGSREGGKLLIGEGGEETAQVLGAARDSALELRLPCRGEREP